ncbi:MAG: ATP-binding protein, partial [Anaerolineales bacterium]|nr:ATP-binding protein [Anaerolineales bacterium]
MLVEFSVGNYKSFYSNVSLSMQAIDKLKHKGDIDVQNVIDVGRRYKLLSIAAVYGANASGKSNLINAMAFMRQFVLKSSTKL